MNREEKLAKVIMDNQISIIYPGENRIPVEMCRYCGTVYNLDGSIDCAIGCPAILAESVFRKGE